MPDYNIAGLDHGRFEEVIQSLAKCVIAAGVTPFGNGPDGGREATFEGRMDYPSQADPWDGYLVIQCKFCKHPTGDHRKDGQWVINQLRGEFDAYDSGQRRIPEYYLFVTNVRLSAVLGTGTKDRVRDMLAKFASKHGLKRWDVWSHDEICRFLDKHEAVRNAYTELLIPGDVVAKLAKYVDTLAPVKEKSTAPEIPGGKVVADSGVQARSAVEPQTDIPLSKAGIEFGIEKGREIGRLELANEILTISADKPMAPGELQRVLGSLRQRTNDVAPSVQVISSDPSLMAGASAQTHPIRKAIGDLLNQNKHLDALAVVEKTSLAASWCDLAVFVHIVNGDKKHADETMEWCRAQHDEALWRRCLLMYAKAEMKQGFSARKIGDVITPDSLNESERVGVAAARNRVAPILGVVEARQTIANAEEADAVTFAVDLAYLLGQVDEVRGFASLLGTWKPVPLKYADLVCNGLVDSPADLPERLRADHSKDIGAQCSAAYIEGKILGKVNQGIAAAMSLVPKARSNEERENLASVLTELLQALGFEPAKEVETAIEYLLTHSSRLQQLFRAHCYLRNGKTKKAAGLLAKLRDESDPHWLQLQAGCLAHRKEYGRAADALAKAADLLPHPELLRRAASAALGAGKQDLAKPILEKLLQLGFGDKVAHTNLAAICVGQKDYANAARHFEALRRLEPDEPHHAINLAVCLSFTEGPEGSLRIYDEICSRPQPPIQAISYRAQVLKAMGRPIDALTSLEKFRGEYWDNPEFVLQVMELAYASDRDEEAGQALIQLQALQVSGKTKAGILTPVSLEDLKQHVSAHRKRSDDLHEWMLKGRAPWLLADDVEGRAAYWGWLIRTQPLFWPCGEPHERARYSIYATNGFGPRIGNRRDRVLDQLTCSERHRPVVADLSALITLHRLGLLGKALEYFGRVLIPSLYLPHLLSQGGKLVLHQFSLKSKLLDIREHLDAGKMTVLDAPGAGSPLPNVEEYSQDDDLGHHYHIRDLAEVLHAGGKIKDETYKRLLKAAHKPSGVDTDHPSLQLGQDIMVELTTLRTLAHFDVLPACVQGFQVYIAKQDYEQVLAELRAIKAQEDARDWNSDLWKVLRTDDRVEVGTFDIPTQMSGVQAASVHGDVSFAAPLLAQQRKLPLMVDDRVYQALLLTENDGLSNVCFSSDRLIVALAEANLIDADAAADAFMKLIQWRYRFVIPTPQILRTLADRYTEHPPGQPLIEIARYAHDCMHDPGLFSGWEPTKPPSMMSLRLFHVWCSVVAEFLMDIWLQTENQERAAQLTEWATTELVPAIPLTSGPQGWKAVGQSAAHIVLSMAFTRVIQSNEYAQGNAGLKAIAIGMGLDESEYLKIFTRVIDAL